MLRAEMESPPADHQLSPSGNAPEDPFGSAPSFPDFNSYEWQNNTAYAEESFVMSSSSVSWETVLSSSNELASTCHRGSKDFDGYEMICFCIPCQDLFLAQEANTDISGFMPLRMPVDSSSPNLNGATMAGSNRSFLSSSCTSSPSRPSSTRQHHASKTSGVSKSATYAHTLRPEALIHQLETALHGDAKASPEFKWKTSILFNELKRLIKSESSNRQLRAADDGRRDQDRAQASLFTSSHSRKKMAKQTDEKVQPKNYHCTSPRCSYSSNSAMDWKRHEEKHWPQRCFMCIECATSPEDSTRCSYCLTPRNPLEGLNHHYLQCQSARRNGRTFTRKDKLSAPLQKDHSAAPSSAMLRAAGWTFEIDSGWPRQCGFCDMRFGSWDERAKHLVEDHFKQGTEIGMWKRYTIALQIQAETCDYMSIEEPTTSLISPSHFGARPASRAGRDWVARLEEESKNQKQEELQRETEEFSRRLEKCEEELRREIAREREKLARKDSERRLLQAKVKQRHKEEEFQLSSRFANLNFGPSKDGVRDEYDDGRRRGCGII